MKNYSHLFFDLDHTLWDFHENSKETLKEIYREWFSELKLFEFEEFYATYVKFNDTLWASYRSGRMSKETLRIERFRRTLYKLQYREKDEIQSISKYYLDQSPQKTNLIPGTKEVLDFLKDRYRMIILTNGFQEVQEIKMANSGLSPFFSDMITAEMAGVSKPKKKIFQLALKRCSVRAQDALMIGDNLEVDVIGAKKVGIDQVWFNPEQKQGRVEPTYEIHNLTQILDVLN
ncbi:MAG TPA: noncanonical pyrimidine nucleotidase, YjjG family [Flavobacteriales bacterium]|jgi:putative hydrolase of the HAD superfamily|nr:noncanonical pyrimidine nucleotidase, YjjG family [Flavobacteriales bacterium]